MSYGECSDARLKNLFWGRRQGSALTLVVGLPKMVTLLRTNIKTLRTTCTRG